MQILEAKPGEQITTFATRLLVQALRVKETVYGEFNQHTLEAKPGMTRAEILKPWNDAQRVSYFGGDR